MAIAQRTKWILGASLAATLCVIAAGLIYHYRPLIRTSDWRISFEDSSEATVYRMLGRPHIIFIKLKNTTSENYKWFSVDTKNQVVALPSWPQEKPYLHFNHDMAIGVALDDDKIDDGWTIQWNEAKPTFSNGVLAITLQRTEG